MHNTAILKPNHANKMASTSSWHRMIEILPTISGEVIVSFVKKQSVGQVGPTRGTCKNVSAGDVRAEHQPPFFYFGLPSISPNLIELLSLDLVEGRKREGKGNRSVPILFPTSSRVHSRLCPAVADTSFVVICHHSHSFYSDVTET